MDRESRSDRDVDALDELIEGITFDAYNDDEVLCAFRQVFKDNVPMPTDGFGGAEPVSVVEIDYDGKMPSRGWLRARGRDH